jgi:hypothetical protein
MNLRKAMPGLTELLDSGEAGQVENVAVVATIRSIESISVAPRVDCMTTNVAIAAQ